MAIMLSSYLVPLQQKRRQQRRRRQLLSPFSMALLHKMATCAFYLWFCYKEGDDSNVVTFLYGGGVVEKAMAEGGFFSFIYLLILWVLLV